MPQLDTRIYMRNAVTGEVRAIQRGTPAGDAELQALRNVRHPAVWTRQLWNQILERRDV